MHGPTFQRSEKKERSQDLTKTEHGLFSYWLMKGLEGDADTDGNREITTGKLHAFVRSHVDRLEWWQSISTE